MKVFTYWEGYMPPYIKYCLGTLQTRVKDHIILDSTSVEHYISNLHFRWRQIRWLAQKVDLIRLAVLYKYGGIWADADTIWINDVNDFIKNKEGDFYASRWMTSNNIINGYFLAKQRSEFLGYCLENANIRLERDRRTSYPDHGGVMFGEYLFNEINIKHPNLLKEFKTEVFLPFELPGNRDRWWRPLQINNYIKKNTIAIGLNHSQYPKAQVDKSIEDHLKTNTLFSSCLKYSEKLYKENK